MLGARHMGPNRIAPSSVSRPSCCKCMANAADVAAAADVGVGVVSAREGLSSDGSEASMKSGENADDADVPAAKS